MDMNFGPDKMDREYFEARKINRVQNDGHWPYRTGRQFYLKGLPAEVRHWFQWVISFWYGFTLGWKL
jgi:hypothetical protein